MDTMSSANTKFGLSLFNTLISGQSESNAFISPLSVSVALSMTQLGARGDTSLGMTRALCWEEGKETAVHEDNQKYLALLQTPSDQFTLSMANRLFVEQGFPLLPEFLHQTKTQYSAEAVPSQFKVNADKERVSINDWVAAQTQDKIKDLLAPGVLNNLTRMVLVNAIYFKGLWVRPFENKNTRQLPFKLSNSETKKVSTMTAEMSHKFWMDDGKEGVSLIELPYKGGAISMVVLLPTKDFGLKDVEKSLTSEKLNSLLSKLELPKKVKLFLPKFEMKCSFKMKEPLCKLGMSLAFDHEHADFSGMTRGRDLCVSDVVHQAFVKVDEEGSEAAAATAVMMMMRCMMVDREPVPEFVVDHPFLFVMVDKRASNSVLFMGRVTDPSQ